MTRGWSGRNEQGRFTAGNQFAVKGWEGLVQRRFNGDITAAREWLSRIGKWEYARQAQITRSGTFQHPGNPETFLQEWRQRLNFRLSDVTELKF